MFKFYLEKVLEINYIIIFYMHIKICVENWKYKEMKWKERERRDGVLSFK